MIPAPLSMRVLQALKSDNLSDLISIGFEINFAFPLGLPPQILVPLPSDSAPIIAVAAFHGAVRCFSYILSRHPWQLQNLRDDHGRSLLHFSAASKNFAIFSIVAAAFPNLCDVDGDGLEPVHYAARFGSLAVLRFLWMNGVFFEKVTLLGTVIQMAVENSQREALEWLLARGISADAPNPDGLTPIYFVKYGNECQRIVDLLVKNGASLKVSDEESVLEHYIVEDDRQIVKLLIARGADPFAIGPSGLDAFAFARDQRRTTVLQAMEDIVNKK
jgi:hypothetical protein